MGFDSSDAQDPLRAAHEANLLYWETSQGVNRIVEALGLSKGALYELLKPLESNVVCSSCGHPEVFLNRTARAQLETTCLSCATEDGTEAEDTPLDERPETPHRIPTRHEPSTLWLGALLAGVTGFLIGRAMGSGRGVYVRRD